MYSFLIKCTLLKIFFGKKQVFRILELNLWLQPIKLDIKFKMKQVLIAGAGKSSALLIDYMLKYSTSKWRVVVMDSDAQMIVEKLKGHPKGRAAVVDVLDDEKRSSLVASSDIVLSLLPPHLHILLAKDCLRYNKHLLTSSYCSDEMFSLNEEAKQKGLLFMCEMGLDPGIDHMSSAALITGVRRIAGEIIGFKSYCGGLIAPENDDNPWSYKISWNARNVVLAGKSGGKWLENGKEQELPYQELYKGNRKVKIEEVGSLAYYPNRDSLNYIKLYGLEGIKDFMRATLRYPNFVKGWEYIVDAGLTDTEDDHDLSQNITYAQWIAKKLGLQNKKDVQAIFQHRYSIDDKRMKMLEWLGIFEDRTIHISSRNKNISTFSSADILTDLLSQKWAMGVYDKDMVIMQHEISYERRGILSKIISTLVVNGENKLHSAMAKTVGLPIAILARKILTNNISPHKLAGVRIPTMPEVYVPVLRELAKEGIEFKEIVV